MRRTILLYGATGFTGRLIAGEVEKQLIGTQASDRMILAGRDGERLSRIAAQHRMRYRVFGLDDRDDIVHGLRDVDVVINAAGPFAFTAERLAKAALEADCHYVDINGEVDVYRNSTIWAVMRHNADSRSCAAPDTPPPHRICCWRPRSASSPS